MTKKLFVCLEGQQTPKVVTQRPGGRSASIFGCGYKGIAGIYSATRGLNWGPRQPTGDRLSDPPAGDLRSNGATRPCDSDSVAGGAAAGSSEPSRSPALVRAPGLPALPSLLVF